MSSTKPIIVPKDPKYRFTFRKQYSTAVGIFIASTLEEAQNKAMKVFASEYKPELKRVEEIEGE